MEWQLDWQIVLPAAAAAGAAVVLFGAQRRSRQAIAPVTVAVAVISLAITFASSPIAGGSPRVAVAALVETAGLMALIVLSVRYAAGWQAFGAAALASLAESVLLFRASATHLPAFGFVLWGLGAGAAIAGGLYLRVTDARRAAAMAGAQRAQRLGVARDLHDFVAHDVTAIVAAAQAAQLVLDGDREQARVALERIERTGLDALSSMDRMIHLLRELPADASREPGGIEDIEPLARRFTSTGVPVTVRIDPRLAASVPRDIGGTAYRIVSEALTNVRRHAAGTEAVQVTLTADDGLTVEVANSPATGALTRTRSRKGTGLSGLSERVHALGGRLEAGADGDGGWRLTAYLPIIDGRP